MLALSGAAACVSNDPTLEEGQFSGECVDGADNDGDGAFDCDDSSCSGSPDCAGPNENAAPSGAAVSISPEMPGDDDDLTCTIVTPAIDPNGDSITYSYAWTVNGGDAGVDGDTVSANLTHGGEVWSCTVTPNDGALDGPAASDSVTIVQGNRPPTAPTIAITPESPTRGDALTCSVSVPSSDADNDPVTYAFTWDADGVAYTNASDAATSSLVNGDAVGANQSWTCRVVASDGVAASAQATATVETTDLACADGSVEGGAALWGRDDIAFCATSDGMLPANISAGDALCASGWHMCSSNEYEASNDSCDAHSYRFSAILDDGDNCMMHDSADGNSAYKCNQDGVRAGYSGSCSGSTSSTSFSRNQWDQNSSGPAPHGTLCCL